MDSYQIEWRRSAVKDLRKLPAGTVARVVQAVEQLPQNPRPAGAKKLMGSDHTYRLRVGSYQVIYSVWASVLTIEVIRVRHRKDAYRG